MKKFLLILFTISIFGMQSFAQETVYLTLEEAITLAKERSRNALIAKHRFRQSFWQFKNFKAEYLPELSLNATLPNFNRSINEVTQPDGTIEYREQKYTSYAGGLSLQQKIGLTGGTVSLNSSLSRTDNIFDTITNTSYLSTPINIMYQQPIFQYNDYRWAKKIEPLKYEEAKRTYMESIEDVSLATIYNFFNLLTAQISLEIAKQNLQNYDTLFYISKGRYNLGKQAENEVLSIELEFLRAQAQLEKNKLSYQNDLQKFLSFLRLDNSSEIVLIPPSQVSPLKVAIEEAIEYAHNNTSKGLEFDRRILQAEQGVNRARMQGRFDADLTAVFGLTQSATELSEAYKKPLDQQHVRLGINVPILDWGRAKGYIKLAESGRDLEVIQVEQEKIDYEQDIYLQIANFNMQGSLLLIAAKADTVSQKNYEITKKRYMIGKINDVLELNTAQINFDQSKIQYYEALETYWQYYYNVRKLTLYDFENNTPLIFDEKMVED